MKPLLSDFIRSKFGDTLTAKDAEQLAFTIFCTLSCLPDRLKNVIWDRERIAQEFVALSNEGYLCDALACHRDRAYWDTVIDNFMSMKAEIDWSLRDRLKL